MDYSKNHEQTLSTEYQDLSFTKHTPLKTSKINSCELLSDTQLPVHLRSSSIASIPSSKISKPPLSHCHSEKQFLRNRVSRSQIYSKNFKIDDETKRNAYLFFNHQKKKLQTKKKTCQYLLPKICVKSKKTYNVTNPQNPQNQNNNSIRNSKASTKVKERMSIFNECKINIRDVRKEVQEQENVTQKFKKKCEIELDKINFMIPDRFRREKCFFDLTQQEILQLYAENRPQKRALQLKENELGSMEKIGQQKRAKRKFNPIRIDSQQSMMEENKSIPLFLMQRLSAKNLYRTSENSFITDVPRMKKKVTQQNQKLRHIV